VNGAGRDLHPPGDLPPAQALGAELVDLQSVEDGPGPADTLPAGPGLPETGDHPVPDHLPLVLSHGGEDVAEEPAGGRRRVHVGLGGGDDLDPPGQEVLHDRDQVPAAPAQA